MIANNEMWQNMPAYYIIANKDILSACYNLHFSP
jgi:hypothetical protein